MSKSNCYGIFILFLLCCCAGISYACNLPPQANIDGCPKYTAVDYETYFDGFSSDPDGYIVDWRWTFPPQAYDVNYHGNPWEVTCKFSPPGIYCVSLEVEDNQGATDTFECTVYALKVNISGNGAYIPVNTDDDNENSIQDKDEFDEPVDNEDDLFQIALWIEPNLPDGSVKLQINVYEGTLSVWADPNKATSLINPNHPNDPTTEHEWDVSGPFFQTVWVEGYYVDNVNPYGSLVVSYLHPTMGHAVDTDGAQFNPVQVCLIMSGVTEDTEEFPGNYVLYNKDDDDNDGVIDYYDGFNKDGIPDNEDDDNPAEDDLVEIFPHWTEPAYCPYEPNSSITGTVKFNVFPPGTTKVKVWKADPCYPISGKLKHAQVSLPEEYITPDDLPKTFYVEGIEPSNEPGDVMFTLTYEELGFVDTVKVTVVYAEFVEDTGQIYGYDDYSAIDPWKSVRDSSNTDTAKAEIETSGVAGEIYFGSSDTNKVTVSPVNASTSPQIVTFTGISRTTPSPTVWAKAGSIDGCIADLIDVAVYKQVVADKTQVKLIYVVEDNDDVQEIDVGKGEPNQTAVNDGVNNILETLASDDDEQFAHEISTGPDGICDTTANNLIPSGDDDQVIQVGEGKANQICVSPGSNGKRDTNKDVNDVYTETGESIHTGSDGICDTAANNTDIEPNTGLITAAGLETYLNTVVFNQCVANTFSVEDGGSVQVNYDLDRDGKLNWEAYGPGMNTEPQKIIDAAKDLNYDYNVFIVKDLDFGTGFAYNKDRYAFVSTQGVTASALKHVIAHELGHAFGNLSDIPIGLDDDNLMREKYGSSFPERLRKGQWDTTQNYHNPQ